MAPTLTTLPTEIQEFIVELVAEQETAWRAPKAPLPAHVIGEPRAHLDCLIALASTSKNMRSLCAQHLFSVSLLWCRAKRRLC